MKQEGRILIVDDDEDILTAGKLLLGRKFTSVATCNRPEHIPSFITGQTFDAILLDMNFNPGESDGEQGFFWLKKILELKPDSVIIMITAHGGVDVAVEAMKLGATDFIAKPWQNEKVIATISTAVQLGRVRSEAQNLRDKNKILAQASNPISQHDIIGESQEIQAIHSLIQRAAPTDANVLILGENGTGKELFAREVHRLSHRANNVFMSIDLGAISESLFESELFGHKKGTFTGAQHDRVGRLEAANGGTLFLDEIGNLPLHLQTKLLTVLEQRKVTPIGANQAVDIDVRVIAATNVDKNLLNDERKFRQDLLFRLNTVEITLPALRQRPADIIPIANHYISLYSKKYAKPVKKLAKQAIETIVSYPWPGNIRALRHAVERAIILSESNELTLDDFQLSQQSLSQNTGSEYSEAMNATQQRLTTTAESLQSQSTNQGISQESSQEPNRQLNHEMSQELNLEALEKNAISLALKKHRYNISHTAKELGLTRAALYRRMEKHGL